MTPVYVTPGIDGQPRSPCGTTPVWEPGCAIASTLLARVGTRLFGGGAPSLTHLSRATRSARCAGYGLVGLVNCWHAFFCEALPTPCDKPDIKQKRTSFGSLRSRPWLSVVSSDPALTQYSLDVL